MESCLNHPSMKVDCSNCLKLTETQDKLLVENEKLKNTICQLESRLRTRENATELLMRTFQILQKRESEIGHLKSKIASLENNEPQAALKSKLQYVQSLNLNLQEELSCSATLSAKLEDANAEISRLTQLLSQKRKHTIGSHQSLTLEDIPRRSIKRFSSSVQGNFRLQELDSMPLVAEHLQSQVVSNSVSPPFVTTAFMPSSPTYENNLDCNLELSDNDFSIFSEEMAGVLGPLC